MTPPDEQFIPAYSSDRMEPPPFDAGFRTVLRELLRWRRDVRQFRRDPLPDGVLERLLALTALAPSVGLSEPWRFVLVEDAARRQAIRANFEACNADALAAQPDDRQHLYARLKLSGLDDAPCHLAVFADPETPKGGGLGRRTMPRAVEYSTVIAVQILWLAARAEGIGVGWVSILTPETVARILDVPPDWVFIGYLCIGYPAEASDTPELERAGWEHRTGIRLIRR